MLNKNIYLLVVCLISFSVKTQEYHENAKKELSPNQAVIDFAALQLEVLPQMLTRSELASFKKWIDEMMPMAYEDFDTRVGITWDDYWLTRATNTVRLDTVAKYIGEGQEQHPQSLFSYPAIKQILFEKVLPDCFACVEKHTILPEELYMQTFVLRSEINQSTQAQKQHVRWHRDPSPYDAVADYTLVLMLSDGNDLANGWSGGELYIKNGLPEDENPALKVIPRYNQAIIFNNKNNSHLVTAIQSSHITTRDILIVNIYLEDPSRKSK
jgi:hypothetical protein